MDDNNNKTKKTKLHYCAFPGCSVTSSRFDRIRHHYCIHTGERPFVCDVEGCCKCYTSSAHLKRHSLTVHSDRNADNKIRCPQCDKYMKTQENLKKHIKRAHEERKFECTNCNKSFKKHQHLKIHQYEHTGVKPFLCPVENCHKSFKLPSKLKRHRKVHEGYACDVEKCNEILPSWTALRKHKALQHAPQHKCETCDRIFSRPVFLQQHKKSHADMREAFHCSYKDCPRYYFFEKNLVQHIHSFHLNQNLKCPRDGCNKSLVNQAKLKHHLKLHDSPSSRPTKRIINKGKQNRKAKRRKRKSMISILTDVSPPKDVEIAMLSNPDVFTVPLPSSVNIISKNLPSTDLATDDSIELSVDDNSEHINEANSMSLSESEFCGNNLSSIHRIVSECSSESKECCKIINQELETITI